MRLTHIRLCIRPEDFSACYDFYRDGLGLATDWPCDPPYAEFRAGEGLLGLFDRGIMAMVAHATSLPAEAPGQDRVVACFDVDDVDAAYAQAVAKGGVPVAEPQDQPVWHLRIALVRDPAGNLIELNRNL